MLLIGPRKFRVRYLKGVDPSRRHIIVGADVKHYNFHDKPQRRIQIQPPVVSDCVIYDRAYLGQWYPGPRIMMWRYVDTMASALAALIRYDPVAMTPLILINNDLLNHWKITLISKYMRSSGTDANDRSSIMALINNIYVVYDGILEKHQDLHILYRASSKHVKIAAELNNGYTCNWEPDLHRDGVSIIVIYLTKATKIKVYPKEPVPWTLVVI